MRILVAAGIFPPDPGGPATHLAHIVPEFLRRGHRVRALAYGHAVPGEVPCPVTRIPPGPLALRQLRYALAYREAAAWADAVYATSLGLPRPTPRRPTVLRVPGDRAWERAVNRGLVAPTEDIDRFQTSRYGIRVGFLRWARAREAQRADRVIAPSEYVRRLILGWGVEAARVRVIYSGVPPDRTCSESRDQARERLGWGREERCLLAVARLTAWKGVDLLIEAASRVPRVRLVVAGDGPARSALAAQAAARRAPVEFLGTVPRERIAVHLRATDYVVVYSGYEGLSHTILEALHTGTPIIASDRGGNPEIVRDGENGLLVPYPDVEALEAAIRRAFEPGTRARLAADAARGLERFSWPAVARSIVDEVESAGDRRCGF